MIRLPLLSLLAFALLPACAPFSSREYHDAVYNPAQVPAAPDYGLDATWAALPDRDDAADGFPEDSRYPDRQATATADVFFLYPTIYTDEPDGRFPWNASVTDAELNEQIDGSTIRLQASVFNAAGRVFSPRYRQAHISAYYTDDKTKAQAAFDTAYADVRAAFELFLRKHNQGRPIIVAGHSQGTTMAKRLVRDYFDPGGALLGGSSLAAKLVAAYLVGIRVEPDYFGELPVCGNATQTGCFVTWRTWQRPATPDESIPSVVVNPLSWTTDDALVPYAENPGGALRKLRLIEGLSDAQVNDNILWINRPDFFGKRIIKMDNWHVADYNLFYESVRRNAVDRVTAFGE